jgi:hypothetical protein
LTSSTSVFQLFAKPKVYTKNIIKNNKNMRLSPLTRIFSFHPEKNVSKAKKNNAIDAISEKGTSLYRVELFACRGYTSAAAQSTSQVFAIFEPTTFHKANSVCHFSADNTFTKSSGALVPNATIVSPITRGEIPNLAAKADAPLTSTSAHFIRTINPITRYI